MNNIVEQAREIRRQTTEAAHSLTDEAALNSLLLFDEWSTFVGRSVAVKQRVRHGGLLYECVQAHAPLDNWQPDITPALWKRVSVEAFPEWIQPLGGHDSYEQDSKVSHNGKKWVSTIDGNVWEPGVYGWNELTN